MNCAESVLRHEQTHHLNQCLLGEHRRGYQDEILRGQSLEDAALPWGSGVVGESVDGRSAELVLKDRYEDLPIPVERGLGSYVK